MVHDQDSTSDTRNSPFKRKKGILPLVKGAGGIFSGVQKVLPQSLWKIDHPEIKGKNVMLRPLTRHALDEVATWPKYTGVYSCYNWREFETQEGRDRWYARKVEGEPSSFWLSIHKLNGDLIGLLNIHRLKDDPWHREAEIGIGIRADECGKGYGSDGIRTFAKNIFEKTDLKHLGIGTRTWNKRALRCYEKCGFARCGESTMMINGDNVRFIEMELEKEQFPASQGEQT